MFSTPTRPTSPPTPTPPAPSIFSSCAAAYSTSTSIPVLQEANANIEDATGTTMSSAQVGLLSCRFGVASRTYHG